MVERTIHANSVREARNLANYLMGITNPRIGMRLDEESLPVKVSFEAPDERVAATLEFAAASFLTGWRACAHSHGLG